MHLEKVSGMCGKAAYDYIEKSIELANRGKVDAVATTPINKESLRAGGIDFIGHTEIFGALTHTEDPLTMFSLRQTDCEYVHQTCFIKRNARYD